MSIWSSIPNDSFFNPLTCKNREIYFECINCLIDKSAELPILYESDAKNCLILYLRNCQYAIQEEDIGEGNSKISRRNTNPDNASIILSYFRKCGWISQKEIGRSGENIASVTVQCRKLIDALQRLFGEESNAALTNRLFNMDEILRAALEEGNQRTIRPYANILKPLVEAEIDLKNEFMMLRENIRLIMKMVMTLSGTNAMGQFMLKDELLERFFNDYFFLKNEGRGPRYRSEINRKLRKVKKSPLFRKMQEEYAELKRVSLEEAHDVVEKQFAELDSFINLEYEAEESKIDKKINSYYSLYQARMSMVLSNGVNMEHMMNRLLLVLKDADDEEREKMLNNFSQFFMAQQTRVIGRRSFERRKKQKANTTNVGDEIIEFSEEEMEKLTDELLNGRPDTYSMQNVKEYMDQILKSRDQIMAGDCAVKTRKDALMLASTIIYSGGSEFPYEVSFLDETIQTETAEIRNFEIRRRHE